jgi:hypothetical protein
VVAALVVAGVMILFVVVVVLVAVVLGAVLAVLVRLAVLVPLAVLPGAMDRVAGLVVRLIHFLRDPGLRLDGVGRAGDRLDGGGLVAPVLLGGPVRLAVGLLPVGGVGVPRLRLLRVALRGVAVRIGTVRVGGVRRVHGVRCLGVRRLRVRLLGVGRGRLLGVLRRVLLGVLRRVLLGALVAGGVVIRSVHLLRRARVARCLGGGRRVVLRGRQRPGSLVLGLAEVRAPRRRALDAVLRLVLVLRLELLIRSGETGARGVTLAQDIPPLSPL